MAVIVILSVIACQQRSLYAATIFNIVIVLIIYINKQRFWIKQNATKFWMMFFIGIGVLGVITIGLQIITDERFFLTIYSRLFIFLNISKLSADTSWQGRWQEIQSALSGLEHFWLLGKGFGVSQITRFRFVKQIVLDQSYMYYIWKSGFLGLFSVLLMYFIYFKRAFSIIRKKINDTDRIFLYASLLNTAGMLLIAFANVSIGHFRMMFVWAGIFGYTELLARKYEIQ
jgi:hypothetical protein